MRLALVTLCSLLLAVPVAGAVCATTPVDPFDFARPDHWYAGSRTTA